MKSETFLPYLSFSPPREDPPWVGKWRRLAGERASALGWPTGREDAFRGTRFRALEKECFFPASGKGDPFLQADACVSDGFFVLGASRKGVLAKSLWAALEEGFAAEKELFSEPALDSVFYALNASNFQDGACLEFREKHEEPFSLALLADAPKVFSCPRNLVCVREESLAKLAILEAARDASPRFTNIVTHVRVEKNGCLELALWRRVEQAQAVHTFWVEMEENATARMNFYSEGAEAGRVEVVVLMQGLGAKLETRSLAWLDGEFREDFHFRVRHEAPSCESLVLARAVADGAAKAVVTGKIEVSKGAQKTHARFESKNLLLSDDAQVDCHPELEIEADDVEVAHGSAVGSLDAQALFYLRARGIPFALARAMLVSGFARDMLWPAMGVRLDGGAKQVTPAIAAIGQEEERG